MNIKGRKTTHEMVDVDIDLGDAARSVVDQIRRQHGITSDQWIDDEGFICTEIEWGHGTPGTEQHGKASKTQKKVWKTTRDFLDLLKLEVDSV